MSQAKRLMSRAFGNYNILNMVSRKSNEKIQISNHSLLRIKEASILDFERFDIDISIQNMSKPIIPVETAFSLIACEEAFNALDEKQALYAHNFARASWNGAKICFFERSFESPAMLYIILKAFEGSCVKDQVQLVGECLSKEEIGKILVYTAAFLENCGNYKSFGDSKFVPDCSEDSFIKFWLCSAFWSKNSENFHHIWKRISKFIFAWEKPYALINFSDKEGTTGYYSANCRTEDAEKVKKILIDKAIMSENNRLVKVSDNEFIVKVASENPREDQVVEQDGVKITLKYGQFSNFLRLVNHYLAEARKYSANEIQEKMIEEYIEHFRNGDMERHKESQRFWIKDIQPAIETNIGFIESYLDPIKVRAEFEGFVSIVNKKQSALLTKLVDLAPVLLKHLPWGEKFQVDVFKKPDFTSLEVLAFGSSGVPVGINIPNYDDIREHLGFKNVNLGNAYGEPTPQSIQYTPLDEIDLHLKYHKDSLFVIVALHQLLGHGSGKLLREKVDFMSPLDNAEIPTFYGPNETWHSVFGEIASTYEECRADSVALYLSLFQDVQEILMPELTPQERWEAVYVGWFDLIVGGLRGLIYFDAASKKWLQAHIGASYAIYKVLQEEGGIFQIKETERDGKEYLEIHMNKESFKTKGKSAIGNFLKHLQVFKSSADSKRGSEYFNHFLEVDEQTLKYKEIVEKNKRPRRISIQPHTYLNEQGKPVYHKYDANANECVDSFVAHYSQCPEDVIKEWEVNNQEFSY